MKFDEPGNLSMTMSRTTGSHAADNIRIQITDRASGAILIGEMDLESFAMMITGMGSVPAKQIKALRIDKWGKRIERKSVYVKVPVGIYGTQDREAFLVKSVAEQCPEGFTFIGSSFQNNGMLQLNYARWEGDA